MKVKCVDTHCHLQFDEYKEDDAVLIAQMRDEGVVGIVVGVDRESSAKAVALAEAHEHLFASIGMHPNRDGDEQWDEPFYRTLAQNPKVVAIGECGLDYYRPTEVTEEVKRMQKELFKKQIALAAELDKPLIIHARPSKGTMDAYHDLTALLQEAKKTHPKLRGDIHFFVGGIDEMRALTTLDFTLSFTAVITFARDYDAVIRATSLTSILSETDAPYVAPAHRRGSRNDPFAVQDVVRRVAEIRGEDFEAVRGALLENAKRLFALPI
jgi:TatD DNase family protein